jgi:hypothetical protein
MVIRMVCSGIMGALSRMLKEASKIAEEKGISLNEAINIVMSRNYRGMWGDDNVSIGAKEGN